MKLICQSCKQEIKQENINIGKDIAYCDYCNEAYKISEMNSSLPDNLNLENPPTGVKFEDYDYKQVIKATTRSLFALFLVPFSLVWSGGALFGVYNLVFKTANIFPPIYLFALVFTLASIAILSFAAMNVFGKVVISIENNNSYVFTGLGPIGIKKRFDWQEINVISEDCSNVRFNGINQNKIVLEGSKRISFGIMLSEKRQYYIVNLLKSLKNRK